MIRLHSVDDRAGLLEKLERGLPMVIVDMNAVVMASTYTAVLGLGRDGRCIPRPASQPVRSRKKQQRQSTDDLEWKRARSGQEDEAAKPLFVRFSVDCSARLDWLCSAPPFLLCCSVSYSPSIS